MLKQELMPLQPPPQCDVSPRRPCARSPPQEPCPVSRVVTVKERAVRLPAGDELPSDVRVCMEERIEGRIKPERIALEPSSAGTGPGAPGQQRLASWEMQRTTADGCSLVERSSDLGGSTSLQVVVIVVKHDNQTSSFASSRKILFQR